MTETDVKKMLSLIWDMVSKAAKKEYANCVKRTPAIVISADNEIHYATVCLPDKAFDEDQQMYLMNCSGRDLKAGDSVLIEYTSSLSDAFITVKNDGKPWGW